MSAPLNIRASEGPGALMEAARLKRGLHIAALAAQLKVSQARLEALEAERWSQLPDATYARALATSVCRVLGLNAGAILAGMPPAAGASLERVSAGLNRPYRAGPEWRGQGSRKWLFAGLAALLVAAAGLAFWPDGTKPLPDVLVDVLPSAASAALPNLAEAPLAVDTAAPASSSSAVQPNKADALPAPASSLALQPATPVSVSPVLAQPVAGLPTLEIRASKGASWVSVVDGAGVSLAARLLSEGEVLTLEPKAPVRVTLGNAPALAVSWRGQTQVLSGYESTRVAKLELK
ncbi:MAG: helix-turn-helix domain-containing protein [Burkholderiales bacterium]